MGVPEGPPSKPSPVDSKPELPKEPVLPAVPGEELVAHPPVVKAIRGVLRELLGDRVDIENLIGDVQEATLRAARKDAAKGKAPPADLAAWKALARTVASGDALDALKQEYRDKEMMTKLVSITPGEASPEPTNDRLDVQKVIEKFREAKLPQHGAEVLAETVAGDGPSAAARELGISKRKAHKILEMVREHYFMAAGAALTAAMVPLMLMWIRGQVAASDFEANARDGRGVRSTAQVAPVQRQNTNALAEDALARATADAKAGEWSAYMQEMAAIGTLDQDGNLKAQVGQLRDRVNEGAQEFQAKPGPRLRR